MYKILIIMQKTGSSGYALSSQVIEFEYETLAEVAIERMQTYQSTCIKEVIKLY